MPAPWSCGTATAAARSTTAASAPRAARSSRSATCAPTRTQLRQRLLPLQREREAVAVRGDALDDVARGEAQVVRVLGLEAGLHLVPRHRRGDRGVLAGAQRVDRDR